MQAKRNFSPAKEVIFCSNKVIAERSHDNDRIFCLSMGIWFPPTTVPLTIFVFLFDCICQYLSICITNVWLRTVIKD